MKMNVTGNVYTLRSWRICWKVRMLANKLFYTYPGSITCVIESCDEPSARDTAMVNIDGCREEWIMGSFGAWQKRLDGSTY